MNDSDVAIRVEGLGKMYRIGRPAPRSTTLPGKIVNAVASPFQWLSEQMREPTEEEALWALKDVSFEVKRGEVVGFIGHNGAGKSTLLKILSRITEPTAGYAEIHGRVGALLEVGTGMHPELTGRENIYMNGTVLGMRKREIDIKFEDIVEFSGISRFMDTPVKRYSSGMRVRLGFAIAAHLEPEILIVDEVLAVGDTVFQKKCIDKMLEISAHGRTVLFVSHNLSAIRSLCSKAMLLNEGKCAFAGGVSETIDNYLCEQSLMGKEIDLSAVKREGTAQELIFQKVTFLDYPIRFGKPIKFKVRLKSTGDRRIFSELDLSIAIKDTNTNTIMHVSNRYLGQNIEHVSDNQEYLFEIENNLKPNVYSLVFFLRSDDEIQDWISGVVKIEIEDGNPYGFYDSTQINGVVFPEFKISLVEST